MKMNKTPAVRFIGFTENWEQRKLSAIFDNITNAFVGTATPYYVTEGHFYLESNNIKDGQINRNSEVFINDEFYYRQKDKWLHTNDMVMVQSGHVGHAAVIPESLDNSAAHALIIFTDKIDDTNPDFLNYQYQTSKSFTKIARITKGNTIKHILSSDMKNFIVDIPLSGEQKRIASFFKEIDKRINFQQRKYEKLVNIKKSMLYKMFPQNGSKVPEIRFTGFTRDWEQRKFSDLVLIERGGSPRPIDDYITDAPDGLNWVKIGDAPEQGRYITKTAEKIKPEGLSKTRRVQPGDLILSNSMSFGKPYIMGINGCIHDGWLLIRDTQGKFDLKFLCHLLGTDQMLTQYRMFASGSTVNNLNKELVGNTTIFLPTTKEQKVIGDYLESLDNLITLYHRKLEKLKQLKQAMLHKMFL